jgi:ribonuclease R
MEDLEQLILATVARKNYKPLKPKALARKLGVPQRQYPAFRRVLRELLRQGRLEAAKDHTVRAIPPHGTVTGTFRKTASGTGFVRPRSPDGTPAGPDVLIRADDTRDASTGDEVLVKITRKPSGGDRGPVGKVLQVLERATRHFVGTYFERDGAAYVRVDGTVFSHSITVGDPAKQKAQPDDKVVIEMLRFPGPEDRGEAAVVEVLGAADEPGVDTLSVIRAFELPDEFPEDVLEEARRAAAAFSEDELEGREDFTADLVITIDPVDAKDFDDAVSLTQDPRSKHWQLAVHIADVAHFAPPGSALDREARKRATSVYLPQRVLPMFPRAISNNVASLQQDRVRYVKSALMDFTPAGQRTSVRFAEGAIRSRRRFTYEEVSAILADADGAGRKVEPALLDMLLRMRDLAMILRKRRIKRGALELVMPEAVLEYDAQGRVSGAHFAEHDVSHQIIEEFMLGANEAVAEHFAGLGVPFLRRVHPAPEPTKLKAFSDFARELGYKMERHVDRFALQRILEQSADRPERYAIHYALLRSLKQAVYSPEEEEHYALASANYCHFTSPIRRYPDLTVHRLLGRWLHTGKAGSDETELVALGEHCSKMERRAEVAERELVKLKLLNYMCERLGMEFEVIITGVADYGFFGQAEKLPVEGLVHISTLTDDYYYYDEGLHSLLGQRTGRRFRLGDKVKVTVVRVDVQRRQLDFRLAGGKRKEPVAAPEPERVRFRRGRRRHG